MIFDPIKAADFIDSSFKDYVFNTFVIRDAELRKQYRIEIEKGLLSKGPFLDCVDAFEAGKTISELIREGVASSEFERILPQPLLERPLYRHQEEAFKIVTSGENAVITTGTGSGKTECFLYPVLDELFKEKEKGTLGPGVRTLLLYPMNALANDQMKRLRMLLSNYPDITFASFTGDTREEEKGAREQYLQTFGRPPQSNELISRERIRQTPPNILVTNYAMLEYLLLRPKDNVFFDGHFSSHWRHIVLDEAHIYSGATGMEVSMLMRRVFHRIQDNRHLSFILTSATLGNNDTKICAFGSNLCAGTEFNSKCIVRAYRRRIERPKNPVTAPSGWMATTAELLEEYVDTDSEARKAEITDRLDSMYSGLSISNDLHEKMYECLSHESFLHDVREILADNPMPVKEIVRRLNRTEEDIIGLIRLSSYANKDRSKLIDARYHHFVRTLEGAHVSFYPTKTLTLTPRERYEHNGKRYLCFMISVCQFCGAIYLIGERNHDCFIQDSAKMTRKQYFMVIEDEDFFKDKTGDIDLREFAWFINCSTGRMRSYKPGDKQDEEILVVEVSTNGKTVTKCLQCETTAGIRDEGVIRGFYLGQDASSSVVCDALYEQIPERSTDNGGEQTQSNQGVFRRSVQKADTGKARRILSFADSRQEAAYFASYMQYIHNKIAERRLFIEAIRKAENSSFASVFKYLTGLLKHHEYESPTSKAMLIILSEFSNFTRNNLTNTGWIKLRLNKDYYFKPKEMIKLKSGSFVMGDQVNAILDFLIVYISKHGAIYYPDDISFTPNDFSEFSFSGKQPIVRKINDGTSSKKYEECFLLPSAGYSNSILEFIYKQGITDSDVAREILETLVEELFLPEEGNENALLTKYCHDSSVLVLDSKNLEFVVQDNEPFKIYRCESCNRLSTIRGNLSCPTYRCEGKLSEIPFSQESYFVKQYADDRHYLRMAVKEHTAQLGKDAAREYQQNFVKGKINMLSCSTTFEMGVDVGDLETVFMKNMPPKPSNYVQRAGRAGRRIDSAAFSLTFCRLAAHDFYFFDDPVQMIKGKISPPSFKIDNEKIVFRHMYSILLNAYWKDLFPEANRIEDLFTGDDDFADIHNYLLNNLPDGTIRYIKQVVPTSLSERISGEIRKYVEVDLERERSAYVNTLKELDEEKKTLITRLQEGESKLGGRIDYIEKVSKTFSDQKIIDFYSRRNLLPKYGFPVDTVELQTELFSSKNTTDTLSLQRDLAQAISEYAPDSEIIADGKIYKSRYILKPKTKTKEWTIHVALECENCGHISSGELYTGNEKLTKVDCPYCGAKLSVRRWKMILPVDGFATENGELETARTRRPDRETRTEFYYIGDADPKTNEKSQKFNFNGTTLRVLTAMNDKLLVMNSNEFSVCEKCGYATTAHVNSIPDHRNKKGDKCQSSTIGHYRLGHEFRTDVVLLHFDRHPYLDIERIRTLMYTLLKGASVHYEIAEDDIDGCISFSNYIEGNPDGFNIILFDSIPGGAGNVKRIADSGEEGFRKYLETCYRIVKNCSCGDNGDGDASCYSCLRSYRNQRYHQVIKRKYAIDFFGDLLGI